MQEKKVCGLEMEVYSRVVGYYRPIQNWNKGKKEEFSMRKNFDLHKSLQTSETKSTNASVFAVVD